MLCHARHTITRLAWCSFLRLVIVIEWKSDEPRWRQVYEVIKTRIESGEYQPGEKIPSVIKLQEEFGIATATGQKVMRALRADGLIRTEQGMGSFVRRGNAPSGESQSSSTGEA